MIRHPPKALSISPARQTLASTSSVVSYIIAQITGPDVDTVSDAVLRIEKITSDQPSLLLTHVDQLIRAILMQKRFNFTTRMSGAASGGWEGEREREREERETERQREKTNGGILLLYNDF